jgi:hypothetical protein
MKKAPEGASQLNLLESRPVLGWLPDPAGDSYLVPDIDPRVRGFVMLPKELNQHNTRSRRE